MEDLKISVVIPMYYEEKVIDECYKRLVDVMKAYDYELIFINDGSKDNTLPMLESISLNNKRAKIISFSRNFGHQAAVTAGLRVAKGDAVVVIDADLQDPPEIIPDMIKMWKEGSDVVYAKRKKRHGESLFKKVSAKAFYWLLDKFSDTTIQRDTGDFRLMDKKVVEAFNSLGEHNRFIRGMVAWLGFKQDPIEYVRDKRYAGETKYTLKKMLDLSYNGIYSFSNTPIKFINTFGMLTLFFSFLVIVYVVVSKIIGVAVAGWASTVIIVTVLLGIQQLSIGIVGEYISRIYEESKDRPVYIVDKTINLD